MSNHHTNSRWLRNYKTTFVLSDIQKDTLIGTLLGDGYLRLSISRKSARLQVYHSIHAKEYVLWKRNIFKNMILADPFYQSVNRAIRFTTVSHSSLLEFQQVFYKEKIKTIPKNIEEYLTSSLSLAVWFMDDGNGYLDNNALRISTYAFGLEGNLLLQSCLKKNFDLDIHLRRDSKGYQIYIPVKNGSASKFKEIIQEHIIPTMKYKLEHRSPVETYIGGTR
ncbi:MAG: hypothetical protein AAB612_00535 [Patescibacteria group bacterium]